MRFLPVILVFAFLAACGRNVVDDPPRGAADLVIQDGRLYHYVRSNIDGTLAENVHVFVKSGRDLEVFNAREACANAALVTAQLDPQRGQATKITGGRLLPGAKHEDFAFLTYDARTKKIAARIDLPDGKSRKNEAVVDLEPWHLYDLDFATLTVMTPSINRRADFSFGMALVVADPARSEFLHYLGPAHATFRRDETRNGRPALRYVLGGPAFGEFGGSLWIDAAEGYILGVETAFPNRLEYKNFKLELNSVSDADDAAWKELLTAHFAGCDDESEER